MSKMNISISKDEIKEYERLKIISEISLIKQRIQLLESKYNLTFEDFEKKVKNNKDEDFKEWDDYIEWKAYNQKKIDLKRRMDQISNVQDITITKDP
ncbi:MAG: hypothetical protein ACTSW1_11785 [Candidatus Hodarchaeales archaeon]